MKKYQIYWAEDAIDSLNEILDYLVIKSGIDIAEKIYSKLVHRISLLENSPLLGKSVHELKEIGVAEVREIIEKPWRIFYKIDNDKVYILCVLDGRRNVQELLISKVIDGKL